MSFHNHDLHFINCVFEFVFVPQKKFCIVGIYLPCIGITFCYLHIFLYSFNSKKKLMITNSAKEMYQAEAIKIAKSLFASFFLFVFCW